MGNQSSSIDTIGLNNANFDEVSSTLPGGFKLGPQIQQVIQNVPLNQMGGYDSDDSEDSLGLADIFQKMEQKGGSNIEETDDELSNTSPFISSEMYNYLMKGGAKKKSKRSKSKVSKKQRKISRKSKKQHKAIEPETSVTSESSLPDSNIDEDSELDYQSSTAHTDNNTNVEPTKAPVRSEVNTSDIRMITE